jgi:hypothetical protein
VPGLELILFVRLMLADPRRMSRLKRFLRRLSVGLLLLIAGSNLASLVLPAGSTAIKLRRIASGSHAVSIT